MSVSADGRYLAYGHIAVSAKTGWDVWILPLFGDRKPFAYLRREFSEFFPAFSPDGRFLAYTSDEAGGQQVYVVSFPEPRGRWQVSASGGSQPRWSRDGRELLFASGDNTLMSAEIRIRGLSLEVGAIRPLFPLGVVSQLGNVYDLAPNSKRIVVLGPIERDSGEPLTLVINWTADLPRK